MWKWIPSGVVDSIRFSSTYLCKDETRHILILFIYLFYDRNFLGTWINRCTLIDGWHISRTNLLEQRQSRRKKKKSWLVLGDRGAHRATERDIWISFTRQQKRPNEETHLYGSLLTSSAGSFERLKLMMMMMTGDHRSPMDISDSGNHQLHKITWRVIVGCLKLNRALAPHLHNSLHNNSAPSFIPARKRKYSSKCCFYWR